MAKIVLVLDIDDTLFNSGNLDEQEWIGSKQLWLDLLFRLKNTALKNSVELDFAIATSKRDVDDLVVETAYAFNDYLIVVDEKNRIQSPVIKYSTLTVSQFVKDNDINNPWYISSAIQIEHGIKADSLERIACLFNVRDLSNIYLVDDSPIFLKDAEKAGFSTISAEGICVPDKEQRDKNALELISKIETEITKKIKTLKPNNSLFLYAVN